MKKVLCLFLTVACVFLLSCNDDEKELEAKISGIQKILDESTQENKVLTFKNILLSKETDNILVKEVTKNDVKFSLLFEDAEALEADTSLISEHSIDSANWSVTFSLKDSTSIETGFLSGKILLGVDNVVLNPYLTAPLSALIKFTTPVQGKVKIGVKGQDGINSDVTKSFEDFTNNHEIQVLGLYPGFLNDVSIIFTNRDGMERAKIDLRIQTVVIPSAEMPQIEIIQKAPNFQNGFIFFDLRPHASPMLVDQYGKIRWYLKPGSPVMYGLQRLQNGNIGFGTANGNEIMEYDMMGRRINKWTVQPLYKNVHHDVYELPNGNFIVTVDEVGAETTEDKLIEIDRTTGAIKTVWDLLQILPKRTHFISDSVDWFHNNAVTYDQRDNTLIISGQRMGLVKVTWDNKLKWILSQPEGWPAEFEPYLLKSSNPDMEWIWGQHAPLVLPSGNIFVFDNGLGRHYGSSEKFSRAVEFAVTENSVAGGSVEFVWEYGRERGLEFWSPIISDVDFITTSNTRLITSGSVAFDYNYISNTNSTGGFTSEPVKAKIVEVDFQRNVILEMVVKSGSTGGSVYRAEKLLTIYPN